jgi:ABC-2 type transport system permease protein
MMGLALSELLFGLPALVVLASLVFLFGGEISELPLLVATVLLIWASMSALGFFLSSHMLHMRNATQVISFVNVLVAVIPPVYYSVLSIPESLRALAYAIPTTHASLMLQSMMGQPVPRDWSPVLGFSVKIAYLCAFVSLAKVKAIWREG